jgi:hypothetical protein
MMGVEFCQPNATSEVFHKSASEVACRIESLGFRVEAFPAPELFKGPHMQFVCDAVTGTWFRFETEGEACLESRAMGHAVERYFRQAHEQAAKSYVPPPGRGFEQKIGLKAHIQRAMPLFLTLRDKEGKALVTAMLPPGGKDDKAFRPIIVGRENTDPYPEYGEAIRKLGDHFGLSLERDRCFPYRR